LCYFPIVLFFAISSRCLKIAAPVLRKFLKETSEFLLLNYRTYTLTTFIKQNLYLKTFKIEKTLIRRVLLSKRELFWIKKLIKISQN